MSEAQHQPESAGLANRLEKSPALWAAGIVLCLFGLTFLILTPVYDTNDDPVMGLVASGYGTVVGPDEHLLYTNVLIGLLLKHLYMLAPLIPWYGGYLLLAQFVAHWLLLYSMLLLKRNRLILFSYLMFYVGVGVYFLVHVQFTSTAFLIGLAGLSLIMVSLMLDCRERHRPWLKWGGACCLIFASLVRFQSLQMLVLTSLPMLLLLFYQYFSSLKIKVYLLPAALAVFGVLGGHYYDAQYYQQDEEWREFLTYHAALAPLINDIEIPYNEQTQEVFADVNWSRTDYRAFREWVYLDQEKFSLDRMQRFQQQVATLPLSQMPEVTASRMQAVRHALTRPVTYFSLFATLLFTFLGQKGSWQRKSIKWTVLWCVLIMAYLVVYKKLPDRVFSCLIALCFYFTLLMNVTGKEGLAATGRIFRGPLLLKTGMVMLILLSSAMLLGYVSWSDRIVKQNTRLKQDVQLLKEKLPDKVFVAIWTFPIDRFLPLDNQSVFKDFKYLFLNGRQGSPLFQKKMKAFQIESPLDELLGSRQIFFISHPKMDSMLREYLKEYYGSEVFWNQLYVGGNFVIYQLGTEELPSKVPEN